MRASPGLAYSGEIPDGIVGLVKNQLPLAGSRRLIKFGRCA